jgi:hypothetical protein
LLINLVVDALAAMLDAAKKRGGGGIQGLVPHLIKGGLTHLQYADNTVLMIQDSEESILNLKLLLYCFENMSGMKINYYKSEVYVIGRDSQRMMEVADKLNCKLVVFPMIYLGVSQFWKGLRKVKGLLKWGWCTR